MNWGKFLLFYPVNIWEREIFPKLENRDSDSGLSGLFVLILPRIKCGSQLMFRWWNDDLSSGFLVNRNYIDKNDPE